MGFLSFVLAAIKEQRSRFLLYFFVVNFT